MRKQTYLISQIPFSSEEKKMSTLIRQEDSDILLSKGAPEVLLKNVLMYNKEKYCSNNSKIEKVF